MAGGLGIRLGGTNFYASQAVYKPFIGDNYQPLAVKHIGQSIVSMFITSALTVLTGAVIFAFWRANA